MAILQGDGDPIAAIYDAIIEPSGWDEVGPKTRVTLPVFVAIDRPESQPGSTGDHASFTRSRSKGRNL
jgi:hypothetical protein